MRGRYAWPLALVVTGCLADSERPQPAELLVTAEASDAMLHGFTSSDGWTIQFDVFALTLGRVNLSDAADGSCVAYSFTNYTWLRDYTEVAGPAKVGIVYGLGDCEVSFRTTAITPATRTEGQLDDSAFSTAVGVPNVFFAGHAERSGEVKRFEVAVELPLRFGPCVDHGLRPISLRLSSGESLTWPLAIRGEQVFADGASTQIFFDYILTQDIDQDGVISSREFQFGQFGADVDDAYYEFHSLGFVVAPADAYGCSKTLP